MRAAGPAPWFWGALAYGALLGSAHASASKPRDVHPPITLPWLATQLVPSPQVGIDGDGASFGLRWQVTPFLYSWGLYRKLSPYRFFVAEPLTRHAGSIELFLGPEFLDPRQEAASSWLGRFGVRSYFPVLHRGEYLAVSLSTSAWTRDGRVGSSYELGAYVLYGVVGAQVTWSPTLSGGEWLVTLRLRYF